MAATQQAPLSIFDLFGDNREMSYTSLIRAGEEFSQPKIIVDLLIQHALTNSFIEQAGFKDEKWSYRIKNAPQAD